MHQSFGLYIARRDEDGLIVGGSEEAHHLTATHHHEAVREAGAILNAKESWTGLNVAWLVSASGRVVWIWTPEIYLKAPAPRGSS